MTTPDAPPPADADAPPPGPEEHHCTSCDGGTPGLCPYARTDASDWRAPALPQPPPVGAAAPLTAAYCAERAAYAIHLAEAAPFGPNEIWLQSATAWHALAAAMATHQAMARPRDPDNNDRRR